VEPTFGFYCIDKIGAVFCVDHDCARSVGISSNGDRDGVVDRCEWNSITFLVGYYEVLVHGATSFLYF